MDGHPQPIVAITNRREVVDPAVLRRFGHVIEVPLPDLPARIHIWRLLTEGLPWEGTPDWEALAGRFPLSGGRIANAVRRAALEAVASGRSVRPADLVLAAEEEWKQDGGKTRSVGF